MSPVAVFIDTSILDEILDIPGWSQRGAEVRQELAERDDAGQMLIIPISALVETGNHIEQCGGDRRGAAQRYAILLSQLIDETAPWRANRMEWGPVLLTAMRDGSITGESVVDLFAKKRIGGGDLALLVEARAYEQTSYGIQVEIWTNDAVLEAFWSAR